MPIVKIGDRRRSVETHENNGPANRKPAFGNGSRTAWSADLPGVVRRSGPHSWRCGTVTTLRQLLNEAAWIAGRATDLTSVASIPKIRNVSYRKDADDAAARRHPGRPRDRIREKEILDVVNLVLAERGYEGVTFEYVARRAGASKSTLYRRWKDKREMVLAALHAGPARREPEDQIATGSLRGDLLALCRRLNTTMQSTDGRAALLLLQAGLEDPALCEAIEDSLGPTGARLPSTVIETAIERGELPAGVDPFPFEEVVGAALLLRRLNGLDVSESYLDSLIDVVVLPALHATAQGVDALPAGIFSGRPSKTTPFTESAD